MPKIHKNNGGASVFKQYYYSLLTGIINTESLESFAGTRNENSLQ